MHRDIDRQANFYPKDHHYTSNTVSCELKHDPAMMATPVYDLDPDMMGMLNNNWNLNAGPPRPPVPDWSFEPAHPETQALYDPSALTVGASNQHIPISGPAIVVPPTFGCGGSLINNQQPMGPPVDPFIDVGSSFVMPYQDCAILPTLYDGGATYKPLFDSARINDTGISQFAPNGAQLIDNQLDETAVSFFRANSAPQTGLTAHRTLEGAFDSNTLFNEVAHPPAVTLAAINGIAMPELEDDDSDWNGSSSGFSAVVSSPIADCPIPTSTAGINIAKTSVANKTGTKKPKRIRRLCSVSGCGKRARSQDLCIAHGGGRRCMVEGCEKSSQGGNMCIKHGGGKRCKHPGCDKAAQTNALCKAHGGGPRCQFPGCTKSSQGGGFCRSHGGGKRCAAQGCNKGTQRGDFCAVHGGSRFCEISGCMRNDRGGGFCAHHGGGKRCSVSNCNRSCRRNGLCSTHLRLLGHEAGDKIGNVMPPAISAAMSTSSGVSSV